MAPVAGCVCVGVYVGVGGCDIVSRCNLQLPNAGGVMVSFPQNLKTGYTMRSSNNTQSVLSFTADVTFLSLYCYVCYDLGCTTFPPTTVNV